MASSSEVLPWSTWPITVTMGARVEYCSLSLSRNSASNSSSSKLTGWISKPISWPTCWITSMSRIWLMLTMIPFMKRVFRMSRAGTSSRSAISFTVRPSGTVIFCSWRFGVATARAPLSSSGMRFRFLPFLPR